MVIDLTINFFLKCIIKRKNNNKSSTFFYNVYVNIHTCHTSQLDGDSRGRQSPSFGAPQNLSYKWRRNTEQKGHSSSMGLGWHWVTLFDVTLPRVSGSQAMSWGQTTAYKRGQVSREDTMFNKSKALGVEHKGKGYKGEKLLPTGGVNNWMWEEGV